MKRILGISLIGATLFVVGCSKSDVATTAPPVEQRAAPAPKNLTPEQKAQYDKMIQQAGPGSAPPPSGGN